MRPQRVEPGPGQESVWDYPRPPAVDPTGALVVVEFGGATVARSTAPVRVLETSQPPAFYVPPGDVDRSYLRPSDRRSLCEWKGVAHYADVVVGDRVAPDAAWFYPEPTDRFAAIAGHIAFYAQAMDACYVDGERVEANEGNFYGGWITSKIVGPFKGGPGTMGW